jgi:hypothetical protein
MVKPAAEYPFEQFPRGEIKVITPRRKFLSAIMTQVRVYNKSGSTHVGRKLSDLGLWTDEQMYCVAPILAPGSQIERKEQYLCATPTGGRPLMLFPQTSPAMTVFELFDGVNTLVEIADTLAVQTGWPEEKAFAYTRGVFLSLVTVGLCQPKWR